MVGMDRKWRDQGGVQPMQELEGPQEKIGKNQVEGI